ncbi:MAG TPA: AsnC family transcriptional regulator [Ruminococcaceae bacterium]|nr:AsnC family transcriptional regulator [Oscillospiraceae bacterium]
MVKMTTKGRYGIKLMVDLAVGYREQMPLSLKSIAQHNGLSDKYLEQIIKNLIGEGLVRSSRGKQGGYRLSRDPKEITAGEILRATEGELVPSACGGDGIHCGGAELCATLGVLDRIKKAVDDVVDAIPLSDLAEEYIEKQLTLN